MVESMPHGGDRIASALKAQGVEVLFTLCGGHISPILTGAKACGIRVIDTRSEATAVLAADAVARLSGTPGVAVVTAGPGVTNTITAIKNAQLAQSPVLLICGAAATALQGRGALQDIDQRCAVAPHVKQFRKITRAADLVLTIEEAFPVARGGVQGPVCVECPVDLLYSEASVRHWYADAAGKGVSLPDRLVRWHLDRHLEKMFARGDESRRPRPISLSLPSPSEASLARASAELARADRPLLVIGSQALVQPSAASRIAAAVTTLGLPTYLSGMARGLLGRDHPLHLRHHRRQALREADCVVLAGVPCDFRLDYGRHIRRSSTLIAANRSREEARLNRRPDVTVVGDVGRFLEQLAAARAASPASRQSWVEQLRARDRSREREIDDYAAQAGEFVNPIALLRAVDRCAADDAVMIADGGDFAATASYVVRPRKPLSWLDPGVFGTLGVGAGFALGAAVCRPGAEVWIFFGDGAFGYGLAELDTFVRHGIPVIAIVGNDASWAQIAREQVKLLHDDVGTVLRRTDYHVVGAGFGAEGILLKDTTEIGEALNQARAAAASGRPVVLNAWLDRTDFREGSISM
jgi:acetolactate synthase-1/2/3 large subunit